jgi:hypothetical protein
MALARLPDVTRRGARTAASNLRAAIGIGLLVPIAFAVAACGGGGAAGGGACALGGTPDNAAFAKSFKTMTLIDAAGAPGAADPEAGVDFSAAAAISVSAEAVSATDARLCVAMRDKDGKIVKDVTTSFAVGTTRVELGAFTAGSYIVRVGVGGTLVQNLPFAVR